MQQFCCQCLQLKPLRGEKEKKIVRGRTPHASPSSAMLHSPSWWEHSPGWHFLWRYKAQDRAAAPEMELQLFGLAGGPPTAGLSTSRSKNWRMPQLDHAHRVWGYAGYLAAKQALQKGIICKQGELGHWINFSSGGTQDGLTLAISVPPWEEWFAGAVMRSDIKRRCLIWGIWVRFFFFTWGAERGKWEREHQDWKSEIMWCAPVLKMRVRICDEKMERWRRAEMLQHNEKMNSELNSG